MTCKRKNIIVLLSLAFLLAVYMASSVQAKPFYKEVTTEIVDGPFPPDEPDANAYGKGVMHRTLIIKSYNPSEDIISVTMLSTVEVRLYQSVAVDGGSEPGELLFLLKMTQMYEGTLIPNIPGGGMVTGKMVMDWVINVVGDVQFPPNMDLRGHWVTLYKDGAEIKKIGFGVSPFQ